VIRAALAAIALALLQYRGRFLEHGPGIQLIEHWCTGAGDPRIFAVMHHGYYYFLEDVLGRALAALGCQHPVATVLVPLQAFFWLAQAALCYGIALQLTGNRRSAALATVLYGFGSTITDYVDCFSYLAGSFGRSAGLAGALFSLWWRVRGCKTRAYIVALLSLYLHADPPLTVLTFYLLMDALQPGLRNRLALVAVGVSPLAVYEFFGEGRFPAKLAHIAIATSSPGVELYALPVRLRAATALLLLCLAYRTKWSGRDLRPWWRATALLVPAGIIVRMWPGAPLRSFVIQVSGGYCWLWPLEFFGRVVLADAAVQSAPMAAALASLCLWNVRTAPLADDSAPLKLDRELVTGTLLPNCGTAAIGLLE